MADVRVSVVMIVKNEIERLPAGLESFASLGHLLHEVCIYDTGSTDGSIELARSYGAKVEEGYWDDDFARARNCAAAMATGDWLLVVDADEVVEGHQDAWDQPMASGSSWDAFEVQVRVRNDADGEERRWSSPRLYRHDRLHYVSAVHTQLASLDGGAPRIRPTPLTAVSLTNSGFDDERLAHSFDRVIAITTAVIDDPDSDLLQRHLALVDRARALNGRGDSDQAVTDLLQAATLPATGRISDVWGAALLSELLLQRGRVTEAVHAVERMHDLAPGLPLTRWWFAHVLAHDGRPAEALSLIGDLHDLVGNFGVDVDAVEVARTRLVWAIDSGDWSLVRCAAADLAATPGAHVDDEHRAIMQTLDL